MLKRFYRPSWPPYLPTSLKSPMPHEDTDAEDADATSIAISAASAASTSRRRQATLSSAAITSARLQRDAKSSDSVRVAVCCAREGRADLVETDGAHAEVEEMETDAQRASFAHRRTVACGFWNKLEGAHAPLNCFAHRDESELDGEGNSSPTNVLVSGIVSYFGRCRTLAAKSQVFGNAMSTTMQTETGVRSESSCAVYASSQSSSHCVAASGAINDIETGDAISETRV